MNIPRRKLIKIIDNASQGFKSSKQAMACVELIKANIKQLHIDEHLCNEFAVWLVQELGEEWLYCNGRAYYYKCSCCNNLNEYNTEFCPHCGRWMDDTMTLSEYCSEIKITHESEEDNENDVE